LKSVRASPFGPTRTRRSHTNRRSLPCRPACTRPEAPPVHPLVARRVARRYKAPLPLRPTRRPPPRDQPHCHMRHGRPPRRAPHPTGGFPQLNHPTPSLACVDACRLAPHPHRAALAGHWTAAAAATPGCRYAARRRVPLPKFRRPSAPRWARGSLRPLPGQPRRRPRRDFGRSRAGRPRGLHCEKETLSKGYSAKVRV
jgi:hypothetical protein